MAKVTTAKVETTYTLVLNEDEAKALAELLVVANHYDGEGPRLAAIYDALIQADVDNNDYSNHLDENEEVVVEKSA